ncbi:MAG: hypothetical protein WCO09_04870 [bacterium]
MKSSTSIIAYVGNGVVKGGLVLHEKGKKPIVLSARKKNLKYYEERDRGQIETLILSEFETLIKEIKTEDFPKLHNKKCGKPDTALVILSSPWYLSETNTIKMQEAVPFLVTEALIEKATSNIIKAYKGEKDNITVLEQNFLSVIVNGYTITNPIGKKVKDLDINVFTSYARAESVKKIEDIVSSNFHLHNIHIHSQSLVSFSAINDLYPETKDYTVIDVTSALTEILVVKETVLRDTASFPLGRYFLMQTVAKNMNCAEDMAESLVESYLNSKLDVDNQQKVSEAIKMAQQEWLGSFSSVLRQITANGALPKKFYLFAPHDISIIFKQFMEDEEYQQFTMTDGKFDIKIISISDSSPLCEVDKDANTNQDLDASIIIGALFNNKKLFA